jgi:hypothetical protein
MRYRWNDHFRWSDGFTRIEGQTAIGRATVERLKLNQDRLRRARSNWIVAGWDPVAAAQSDSN